MCTAETITYGMNPIQSRWMGLLDECGLLRLSRSVEFELDDGSTGLVARDLAESRVEECRRQPVVHVVDVVRLACLGVDGVDRIRLDRPSATRTCVIDRRVEQARVQALAAVLTPDDEARDRPHRGVTPVRLGGVAGERSRSR